MLFQATGDRCEQLDDIRVGDEVKLEFSLRGREWRSPSGEVKYFNTLDVWKVELAGGSRQRSMDTGPSGSASGQTDAPPPGDDDIPF